MIKGTCYTNCPRARGLQFRSQCPHNKSGILHKPETCQPIPVGGGRMTEAAGFQPRRKKKQELQVQSRTQTRRPSGLCTCTSKHSYTHAIFKIITKIVTDLFRTCKKQLYSKIKFQKPSGRSPH